MRRRLADHGMLTRSTRAERGNCSGGARATARDVRCYDISALELVLSSRTRARIYIVVRMSDTTCRATVGA